MTQVREESQFTTWARAELERAGLFDQDSDYESMLGEAVMELVYTHADEGHSGFSAQVALQIFSRLAEWKPLSPLTDDPNEWQHIEEDVAGDAVTWQSRRSPGCFSRDGGRTFYDLDAPLSWWRRAGRRVTRRRLMKMVRTQPAS